MLESKCARPRLAPFCAFLLTEKREITKMRKEEKIEHEAMIPMRDRGGDPNLKAER